MWVDAHPDVMGPEQTPSGHAHVLAMLMGAGDPAFVATVRRPVEPKRVLHVGLTETSPFETDFIHRHGMARLARTAGIVGIACTNGAVVPAE